MACKKPLVTNYHFCLIIQLEVKFCNSKSINVYYFTVYPSKTLIFFIWENVLKDNWILVSYKTSKSKMHQQPLNLPRRLIRIGLIRCDFILDSSQQREKSTPKMHIQIHKHVKCAAWCSNHSNQQVITYVVLLHGTRDIPQLTTCYHLNRQNFCQFMLTSNTLVPFHPRDTFADFGIARPLIITLLCSTCKLQLL